MKKTYIIPQTVTVYTAQTLLQAASPKVNTSGATFVNENATGAAMTKDNSYNVWDDDWSNN